MRILVLSDLHLEFAPFTFPRDGFDVAVLAGDIAPGLHGLEEAGRKLPGPTLYVAGNHEYYRHSLPKLTHKLRAAGVEHGVHFLENDELVLGGVRFLGATLWTDFRVLGEERAIHASMWAEQGMNDYQLIRVDPSYRKLRAADTAGLHRQSAAWLRERLAAPFDGPTVVVTHHAPSLQSIAPQFYRDSLNPAFASNLEALINECGPALWIHGHTHHGVDYRIGATRIVSNQRGYPGEQTGFDPCRVLEV